MAYPFRLMLLYISPCGYFLGVGLLSKVVEFSIYWALPLLIVYATFCVFLFKRNRKESRKQSVREQQIKSLREGTLLQRRRVVTDFVNIVQGHVKE